MESGLQIIVSQLPLEVNYHGLSVSCIELVYVLIVWQHE